MTDWGRIGPLVAVGRTSDVYEIGRDAVVKVPRPVVPPEWAAMEARFTVGVRELGAPAPEVLDVVEIDGRDAIVFERVHGPSMWDLLRDGSRSAPSIGEELAAVHRRVLSAGLPRAVAGLVERMRNKITQVRQLPESERDDALLAMEQLPRGAALLHGDLHPGNVLMGPRGPVVIDWFDAAIGHPVADVVRSSLLIRPFHGEVERPHMPGARRSDLRALHEAYVWEMADVLGTSTQGLPTWEAVVAASRLSEEAETDESPLLQLWQGRGAPGSGQLLQSVLAAAN